MFVHTVQTLQDNVTVMDSVKLILVLFFLTSLVLVSDARFAGYEVCYYGCQAAWMACVAAAGVTQLEACSVHGACLAACAALAPGPV